MKLDKQEDGQVKRGVILIPLIIVGILAIVFGIYYGRTGVDDIKTTLQTDISSNYITAKEHFEKGLKYSINKEYDKAITEYLESLKYNPDAPVVHTNLGFAYFDKGNLDMAIEEQKKAIESNPEDSNAYYGLALAYERKGEKEKAIKTWEEFIKLAESHTAWWSKAKERLEKLKEE
jgi:tetratricopeptide (TPR) repeat protein